MLNEYNGKPPSEMPDDQQKPSFEQGLEALEAIVQKLESGDLSLEQSLELFENGLRLSESCRKRLDDAETRVEILMKKGREREAEPFKLNENGG